MVVNWVVLLGGGGPLPIQVLAHQAAPVVAYNNSVRVLHGDDFKDELVAEEPCGLFIRYKEVYYALHHPGGIGFTWMHPRRYYDSLSNRKLNWFAREVRYN